MRWRMLSARFGRRGGAVADAAAVEHAVVGRGAEVVEHEVGVAHRGAAGHQAERPAPGQAASLHAMYVPTGMMRVPAPAPCPAGRRCRPAAPARLHFATCGAQRAGAGHQRQHRAVLVQRTPAAARPRQAQRVLQRVQVARARIVHAAVEARAVDPLADFGRRDALQRVAVDRCSMRSAQCIRPAPCARWWPRPGSRRASRSRWRDRRCAGGSGPAPPATWPRRAARRPGRAALR
jgi:hypothetical protein